MGNDPTGSVDDTLAASSPVLAAAAVPTALGPGSVIGPYEIIRELGRGGMGRVVLARDTKLGRRVAIKLLTRAAPELAQRFLHEARTTARLNHEHIVVIHEVDEHDGVPFMVLEYLEGHTVGALVREGTVPWVRAVELVVPIVRALVLAHDQGVIHRDLKPDNVFVTHTGIVKVLDFGIARAFAVDAEAPTHRPGDTAALRDLRLTADGAILGTLPYMSPEQYRDSGTIEPRSDLWAVGLILWELLAGRHPLVPLTAERMISELSALDQPMPAIDTWVPELPEALGRAIDGCLRKRAEERIASARELLVLLEPLLPGRFRRELDEGTVSGADGPYLGLTAFQERDAGRFFGRERETRRLIARLRERPLAAIVGPSGVGKSSFVRAGLIPALKSSGETWESLTLRPGREPLAALATLLHPFTSTGASSATARIAEHQALIARLREQPGTLGTLLRARARQRGVQILLFVDQFEELYTLVGSEADRLAFADCVAGVADDSATPLRVVLSMRSDFLDRIAESPRLVHEVTHGLVLLAPPDPGGLRDALVQPLELAGHRFEDPAIVDDMLAALQATPGALPLLQFVASRLWDARDRQRRLLTRAAYQAMGGIAGALATHADEAVATMAPEVQRLARALLQRLITPERTRAVIDVGDLLGLAAGPGEVQQVIDRLVAARLLVVQARGEGDGPAVELVHESLIAGWPRLRRWLDESEDQARLLAQLQTAAKQWEARDRPAGLLWRGEAVDELRRWSQQPHAVLAGREQAFLDAVLRLATRATRIRRGAVAGTIALLSLLVVAGITALVMIRDAEQEARGQASRATAAAEKAGAAEKVARDAEDSARVEAENARAAEKVSADRLVEIDRANAQVKNSAQRVAESADELQRSNAELLVALDELEADRDRSERMVQQLRKTIARLEAQLSGPR